MNNSRLTKSNKLRLYSTVEPCPMCMSAIIWANIDELFFGASIEDASAYGNQIFITSHQVVSKSWYDVKITTNLEAQKCKSLLEKYFGTK